MHFLKPHKTGIKSFSLVITLMTVLPVTAQTLYQVEVIVFASSNSGSEKEETWPQDKLLAYPENTVALIPENNEPANTAIGDSSINNPLTTDPASLSDTTNSATPSIPATYTELPLQKKMLIEWRDRMRSSGKYRILSHSSWLQPATGPDAGKAVVLTGGNQYGEHYELEGSIRIRGNSQPLKITSDLWLSEFLPGDDSEAVQIQLPPLPKPAALVTGSETTSVASDSQTTEPVVTSRAETMSSDMTAVGATTAAPLYTIKRIITHQSEDNLMPEKPLYLDHPILGILVKISEYKPEQATTPAL